MRDDDDAADDDDLGNHIEYHDDGALNHRHHYHHHHQQQQQQRLPSSSSSSLRADESRPSSGSRYPLPSFPTRLNRSPVTIMQPPEQHQRALGVRGPSTIDSRRGNAV
jgi:hypothetical protein